MGNFNYNKNKFLFNTFSLKYIFKSTNLLLGIKHTTSGKFLGIYKNTYGFIFLNKLVHGSMIGDFNKNLYFPNKYLKFLNYNNLTLIRFLNLNSIVSNVYSKKNYKPSLASSNGTYCQILEHKISLNLVILKLPSDEKIILKNNLKCLIGRNSNINKKYEILGNFWKKFIFGKKPAVRGVAKNPVDHPHGGRTKTNKPEVSPWGWVTKNSH